MRWKEAGREVLKMTEDVAGKGMEAVPEGIWELHGRKAQKC